MTIGALEKTFSGIDDARKNEIKIELPKEVKLVQHSKTFSLRIFTGTIDRKDDFKNQVEVVDYGLQAMTELAKWILDNLYLFKPTND
ncbi:hypothetical protein [Salinimicrobium sediminilitoris]|uniref:hypothetical protein n=1 Tax=Salinimicrobium sediminilitoris TaxID=2876715 RepID=UPI001E4FA72B|nr:hypothetical protein [Salinimicrobium sediminilitoris]